jgi:trigger factor
MSGTDQMYELGIGWPLPQMDTELTGKKAGDIIEFSATLPEGAPHAGDEATFRILVKEVRQKILPPLDDEFAKTASEFETLDELRKDISERIEKVKSVQADSDVRNKVLEQVLDDVEVEVPESLVINEMAFRLERFEEQLRNAGVTLEQYMESQGFDEEQIEQDLRKQAERNVRAQLILEEVGRRENFQVSEDELREEVRYHAETMRVDPAVLAKQLQDRGRLLALAGDIIRRKALNLLVEKADIKQEGIVAEEGDSTQAEQAAGSEEPPVTGDES